MKHSRTPDDRQSTNWDIENAGKNYFILVIAQVGQAVFSFASVWLVTRHLGAEGYGGITALLVASQLAQISIMWTCTALARYGVQEFVETGQIAKTFWARTLILVPNLLLILLLSPFWLPPLAGWLKLPTESFYLVALNFAVTAFWMHVQFALQGAKLPRVQSVLMMLERVLTFLMLLALAMSGQFSWLAAIWAYTIPPLLLTIIGLWKLKPLLSGRISIERGLLKKIIMFSLPLPIYSLLGHLSFNHLDAIFILRYLSTADLGVYSVAYQMNGLVMQLSALAGSLIMPWFVTFQSNNQEKQIPTNYFQNILPALTLGLGFLCVVVATVGYYLLPLIFGEKFSQVGILLWILIAASAVSVPVLTGFLPLSNSTSVTYVQMIAAAAAATANIVCNLLLIPRFGLIGCAWGTVISFAVSMLTYAALMSKKFTLPCFATILATLPAVLGAACFSWSGNVILSNSVVFCSGLVFFILNRDSLLKGYEKLRSYKRKDVASAL